MMPVPINIFWFRRDLRLTDNAGLYHALKDQHPVLPIFIFDTHILDKLEDKADRRVQFIYETLHEMQDELAKEHTGIEVLHAMPVEAFKELVRKYTIIKVFTNHDYEPYARERDEQVKHVLKEHNIELASFKDHVLLEKDEVLKDNGQPYTVFTPYSRKWAALFRDYLIKPYPVKKYNGNFLLHSPAKMPSLEQLGFTATPKAYPAKSLDEELLKHYSKQRDYPGIQGTSRLGIHLRFGTISIRELAARSKELSETFLNELIWRDFYQAILWHFRKVGKGSAFKAAYENIEWRTDNGEFEKWSTGQTGYPIVDAGMRELNETGFMHNRVRMITASFLCKHLLLDWRLGEAYFAEKLLDYDLAANNGGWQWAAGSGCDAAPYFRIFNPYLQAKKFDPKMDYIKKWVPEVLGPRYPTPIVDHVYARKRCLEAYNKALNKEG